MQYVVLHDNDVARAHNTIFHELGAFIAFVVHFCVALKVLMILDQLMHAHSIFNYFVKFICT